VRKSKKRCLLSILLVCLICLIASFSLFDFIGPVFDACFRFQLVRLIPTYLSGRLVKSKVNASLGNFVWLLDLFVCLICLFA
jgi:hypothetical protein